MDAIGVFDSGVGGLTVVAALRRRLPRESILYLGDTARLPYGSKSPATVTRYTRRNVDFLAQHGVKAVVVACNTASALALPELALPMPVWGVIEPGAERAAAASGGRVGVIATEATVRSDAYPRALRRLRPDLEIASRACPLFVPLVEEGWYDDPITEQVAGRYLAPLLAAGIDTLVLGCTHYPLLAPVLAKVAGPAVELVDSAEAVAEEVAIALETTASARSVLGAADGAGTADSADTADGADTADAGKLRVCVTDASQGFQTLARRILGAPELCLEWVEV
ncbi:MAG TPA: glutamate racemase [Thermoanaerobaculia bacterium]|nr:glutamate racemase [Thermoanaerobaculia bacterium]